ncbi:MAG: site-specific integrase [Oscillospiraceae bacterium]|jgi:integrase|nr:site-specific integrase [Oscillospiraceae bacterium]
METEKTRFRSTFTYEGKRHECTGSSQKEADQKAAIKEDMLKRGEIGISGNMKVSKWADEWLETYKRPAVGEEQYRTYISIINNWINPTIGSMSVKSVKTVHLQKIMNSTAGCSGSHIKKINSTLYNIFKKAQKSNLIVQNPAEELEKPSSKDGVRRSITDNERVEILKLAETHHAGLWIKTLLYTGIRPNESRALDWKHIDFKKRILHVKVAMKAGTKDIDTPKTESGIRDIPICDALYDELYSTQGSPFHPVFTHYKTGLRHTKATMDSMWRNFKRQLDISMGAKLYRNKIVLTALADDLVPYCLRHTFCTDLQDAGIPINIAKYLMGHSNISITAKIYTDTTERALQIAAKKMNCFTIAQ